MNSLAERKCEPCRTGAGCLSSAQARTMLAELNPSWQIVEGKCLEREFKFPNFRQALDFANKVGEIAESEEHHPDMLVAWGRVHLTLWTHSAGGLTENDFILAAKIDRLLPEL